MFEFLKENLRMVPNNKACKNNSFVLLFIIQLYFFIDIFKQKSNTNFSYEIS